MSKISSASAAAAAYAALRPAGEPDTGSTTITDQVAADGTEPVRTHPTTIGTLVDLYL